MPKRKKQRTGLPSRLLSSLWRRKWLLLLLVVVVCACTALVSVTDALSRASGYIRLDFQSAPDGLTPGGTRFNIYDIKSEALLTRALSLTGLSGKMTWRELAQALTVAPSRTQSVSKRYIATEYTATLAYDEKMGGVSARSLLDVVYRLYYQDFLAQNGLGGANIDADWSVLPDMEYYEVGDYVKTRADMLRQFLQNRINGSGAYESQDPALSFRALRQAVETFQTVYVDKYTALVSQSRLFKDAATYETKLTFQRMLVDQSYQLSRAQFAVREDTLKDYEESLIAIVMVPTYYQGSGLYMSRTQIGIDTLTKEAESYSLISQRQALKLAKIDESLAAVAQARSAASAKADALIDDITRQFDALVASIRAADDAYIAYTARNYLAFTPKTIGLLDAYGVKTALLLSLAALALVGGMLFWHDELTRTRVPRSGKGGAA